MKKIERLYKWLTSNLSDESLHFNACFILAFLFGFNTAMLAGLARESVHFGAWGEDSTKDMFFNLWGAISGTFVNSVVSFFIFN